MTVDTTAEKNFEPQLTEHAREDAISPAPSPDPLPTLLAPERRPRIRAAEKEKQIREMAYHLYEQRGKIDGQDLDDWFEAEAIVRQAETHAA
jgi:hypothetical protein